MNFERNTEKTKETSNIINIQDNEANLIEFEIEPRF